MEEAKTRYGVRVAPVTVVGDWFAYGTFAKQRPELKRIFDAAGEGRCLTPGPATRLRPHLGRRSP